MAYSRHHGAFTTGVRRATTPPYRPTWARVSAGEGLNSDPVGMDGVGSMGAAGPATAAQHKATDRSTGHPPSTSSRRHPTGPDHPTTAAESWPVRRSFPAMPDTWTARHRSQGGRPQSDSVPSISRAVAERNDGSPGLNPRIGRSSWRRAITDSTQEQPKLAEATFRNRAITCSVRRDRRPWLRTTSRLSTGMGASVLVARTERLPPLGAPASRVPVRHLRLNTGLRRAGCVAPQHA